MDSYYDIVPKDRVENLAFRKELIQMGSTDPIAARELWIMCARDMLFYVNAFVWTYDPRQPEPAIPFITWDYQDEALITMERVIGNEDVAIEKSRDMGASWLALTAFEYRWHFKPLQAFLMVSRTEDFVDKKNDPDCLFWKIDFILANQPKWLVPAFDRNKLSLANMDNQSTLTGASTTSDTARGGRKTAILLDEFASVPDGYAMLNATRDATDCRIFNSTPKGAANAFYDIIQNADILKIRFHWTMHPIKSIGKWWDKTKKKWRSPWYDLQCARAAHPQEIAQELDIDYLGSDFVFFDPEVLTDQEAQCCLDAFQIGDMDYDVQTGEPVGFINLPNGRLRVWTYFDATGRPSSDRAYVLGVDVATGTGSSNSAICVVDATTGEQVAEFAHSTTRPEELATYAAALGYFFSDHPRTSPALVVWEANGCGRNFGERLIDIGYENIYMRRNDASITKKVSNIPGWFATKETKFVLFGDFRKALQDRTFVVRSRELIRECREYIFTQAGSLAHARSLNTIDPSGAKDNHGDRATAGALARLGLKSYRVQEKPKESIVPVGSFLYRREERMANQRRKTVW